MNKLTCLSGPNYPQFKFAVIARLPQPPLHEVVQMFSKYGAMIYRDMTEYAEDIFGRTGGHLGLVSAFGKTLQTWIDSVNSGNQEAITIGAWLGHICHSKGQASVSHIIVSIMQCLSEENDHITITRHILFCLMTNTEVTRDPSQQSKLHKDAVDYLEVIGAIVRLNDFIRFSAPLLRTALYNYFWERMEKESVLPGLVLPFTRIGDSNTLDMIGCIQQALALFDRGTAFTLRLVSVDIVRAFHFHLHCIMTRTVSSPKWHTESQVWNAAGKNGTLLNLINLMLRLHFIIN